MFNFNQAELHEIAGRILSFLEENHGRWYSLSELQEALYLRGNPDKLNETLQTLVRQGMIRIRFDGKEYCYRAISDRAKETR